MIQDLVVFQKTYDFLLWLKPVAQKFAQSLSSWVAYAEFGDNWRLRKKLETGC